MKKKSNLYDSLDLHKRLMANNKIFILLIYRLLLCALPFSEVALCGKVGKPHQVEAVCDDEQQRCCMFSIMKITFRLLHKTLLLIICVNVAVIQHTSAVCRMTQRADASLAS